MTCIRTRLHQQHSYIDPNQLFTLMSPNVPIVRDVSEDPVASLKGHWAGSMVATGITQHSRPWFLSSQSYGGHLGAVSSQGQETWDPWAAVSPHRSYATADKEPTCAAQAMWCSPSCPGNFNSHLQPPEALLGRPSEGWTPGSRNHGKESLHRGQLTLQLSTWCLCQEQLLDVNSIWHKVLSIITPCVGTSDQLFSKH